MPASATRDAQLDHPRCSPPHSISQQLNYPSHLTRPPGRTDFLLASTTERPLAHNTNTAILQPCGVQLNDCICPVTPVLSNHNAGLNNMVADSTTQGLRLATSDTNLNPLWHPTRWLFCGFATPNLALCVPNNPFFHATKAPNLYFYTKTPLRQFFLPNLSLLFARVCSQKPLAHFLCRKFPPNRHQFLPPPPLPFYSPKSLSVCTNSYQKVLHLHHFSTRTCPIRKVWVFVLVPFGGVWLKTPFFCKNRGFLMVRFGIFLGKVLGFIGKEWISP